TGALAAYALLARVAGAAAGAAGEHAGLHVHAAEAAAAALARCAGRSGAAAAGAERAPVRAAAAGLVAAAAVGGVASGVGAGAVAADLVVGAQEAAATHIVDGHLQRAVEPEAGFESDGAADAIGGADGACHHQERRRLLTRGRQQGELEAGSELEAERVVVR